MADSHARISTLTRALHWTIAAGIIGMIAFGFYISGLERGPEKAALLSLHKSIGVLVGGLALIRIFIRIKEGFPIDASPRSWWETSLARGTHFVLLFATVALPLTGIAKSVTYGRPVDVFGVPFLPAQLMAENKPLNEIASELHEALGFIVAAIIVLHVVGALKHHFIDRDSTLTRMVGLTRG